MDQPVGFAFVKKSLGGVNVPLNALNPRFVTAFHSVLGYLNFLSASPFPFDTPPYLWRAFLNWPGRLLRKGKESSSSHTFRSTSPA